MPPKPTKEKHGYSEEEVIAAHEKQRKKFLGQGGIVFTPSERAILDEGIMPEEPVGIKN